MRLSLRLALLVCASLGALAFAGSAWAAYAPRLVAGAATNTPGKPTAMILSHVQAENDDPTAKDTIYVPLGYQLNLSQAVGTEIGELFALVILRNGGNAHVEVEGTITVDRPANYPPASNSCTPGESHEAVWTLNLTIARTPLTGPVYVDHVTAGPETAFASGKLQICLAGPIGTPAGAQLLATLFLVQGVFTNPTSVRGRSARKGRTARGASRSANGSGRRRSTRPGPSSSTTSPVVAKAPRSPRRVARPPPSSSSPSVGRSPSSPGARASNR